MFDPAINRRVFGDWRHLLAFGFGSGLAKYAPGTFGTLVAIPLFLVIDHLPAWLYAVTVLAAFALGVWICDTVSRDLRVHDHGGIVFDEFVGFWITMFLAPTTVTSVALVSRCSGSSTSGSPALSAGATGTCEGGFGIMFDDVAAGVAACAALHASLWALGSAA